MIRKGDIVARGSKLNSELNAFQGRSRCPGGDWGFASESAYELREEKLFSEDALRIRYNLQQIQLTAEGEKWKDRNDCALAIGLDLIGNKLLEIAERNNGLTVFRRLVNSWSGVVLALRQHQ